MSATLSQIINRFGELNVLVIGDVILDIYIEGESKRLCREAPVPVVDVENQHFHAGGAANAAVNAATLGGQVSILSICGDDEAGKILLEDLQKQGVSTENLLVHQTRRTLTKKRIVSGNQMLVRIDEGTREDLGAETEKLVIERLKFLYSLADVVIVSDYDGGFLTAAVINKIGDLQKREPRLILIDSRRLPTFCEIGATAVKPNFDETCKLLNVTPPEIASRRGFVDKNAARILELTNAKIAAVTLDTEGAIIIEQNRPSHRTYTPPRKFVSATGAGDTFTSAFALSLGTGAHTPAAAEIASAAASLVIEKPRTAVCSADELREHFSDDDKVILNQTRIASKVKSLRRDNQKIIFTNGCFDILHRGHITYLNQAKALGDILIVGVNSDASVKRLKQPNRPINPLEDRLQVLSALSCVDFLISFEDDSPTELLKTIRPDVYVKGGDYTLETLPETSLVQSLGGQIEILPFLQDRSTTGIIERIRQAYA